MSYITVDVDINDVLEALSDREWIDLLKGVDDATLAKAGLCRMSPEDLSPISEHILLCGGVTYNTGRAS